LRRGGLLLGEGLVEQPDDYGEVAPLVVGWEDDGVFFFIGDGRGGLVFWRHCVGSVESWIGEGVWLKPLLFNEWKENGYNVLFAEVVLKTGGATREQITLALGGLCSNPKAPESKHDSLGKPL